MSEAFTWWWLIEVMGLVGLPIAFFAFRSLPDGGYNFAKIAGLLLVGFLTWVGASLHVVPNDRWSLAVLLALLAVAAVVAAVLQRRELRELLARRWPYVLASEVLFTLSFAVALYLRSDVADPLPGERPTDLALINAVARADFFPPQDPWLSGHSVNYYYFGHLLIAEMAKLSDVPGRIAFNLGLGLVAALSVSAAFGLGYNLLATRARSVIAMAYALAAPFLLLLVSNLVGVFELMAVHGIGSRGFYKAIDIRGLDGPRASAEWYPTEWLWPLRSINFADGTVDRQFPFAKFMLGELHSENLAIPLVLVVIGLALAFWRLPRGAVKLQRGTMPLALATALVLGAASVTQAWYAPALLALLAFVIISRGYADSGRLDRSTLANASVLILFVGALSVVLFLPFYRTSFSSFGGIILVEDAASRPHHFLYMWLPLGWPAAALAAGAISRGGRTLPLAASAAATATAVVGLWAVAMLLDRGPGSLLDAVAGRASNASWLSVLVIGGLLFAAVLALLQHLTAAEPERRRDERAFALGLVALAALLLVGIEFFWVDDNVVPATGHFILGNYGFNSIIKANFMAWFLLSIAGAFAFHELACMRPSRPRLNAVRWGALAGATLLIALGLVYTVTSTFHSTDRFRQPRHLDLLWQTRASQPGEYEAIVWLDENVKGAPVVLESTGDSYGAFGRVSAATGLPTVLGWQSHEAHWRGGREPQAGRPEAVERIYKTTDASEAKALLQQYDVEFVYVGALERQTYGEEGLGKFAAFMDVAFQGQDVTIYRVREG